MQVVDPFSGPMVLAAWLSVLTAAEEKRPIEDVIIEIQQLPVNDLLGCIRTAA